MDMSNFLSEDSNDGKNHLMDNQKTIDLDSETFKKLGYRCIDIVANYLSSIDKKNVIQTMDHNERKNIMEQPLSEDGIAPELLLDFFQEKVLPYGLGNGHPRFFGWLTSPPAPLGILAELLAAAQNPSCDVTGIASVYLEQCTIRWLMELIGFPMEGSMGLLVPGGSTATLICLTVARYWAAQNDGWNVRTEGLQGHRPPFIMYISDEGHNCLRKSAEILGLGTSALRVIPTDARFKMDVESLRAAVVTDKAAGLRPFCVAASAGTASTGAIDPLEELADICTEQNLWLHIDGTYGAIGSVVPELEPLYSGLKRVHSLTLDPHKCLSIPIECSSALVRNRKIMYETFSRLPLSLSIESNEIGGYGGYSIQQTREFRALKLWMVLQQIGRQGVVELISRYISLAQYLASLVDAAPDLERIAPVELSIVCFRCTNETLGKDEKLLNILNQAVVDIIQAKGEVFVTGRMVRNRFVLRASILHFKTTEDEIIALITTVRATAANYVAKQMMH